MRQGKTGKRIVYGINPVREALRAKGRVERLYTSGVSGDAALLIKQAERAGALVESAPKETLERIAGTAKHQGLVALMKGEYPYVDIEELVALWKASGDPAFFLILDSVQDPQNLGSLIRGAHSAGVHGIVIPKDRAAGVTPAVVKASAGATEHARVARVTNLSAAIERLKKDGVWVASVEADGEKALYDADLSGDLALVVGGEGGGTRRLVRERCDFSVAIPLAGSVNSLNVAQAGVVALYEAVRQRRKS